MFVDARTLEDGSSVDADLCVVGAGAAGIAIGLAFADSPVRVAILESGDLAFDSATQALHEGPNVGLPYSLGVENRLCFFGGTTNHWGGVCRPFEQVDLEPREGVPHSGWPLRLSDVAPFYPKAATLCGLPSSEWGRNTWSVPVDVSPFPFDAARIETRVAQIVPSGQRSFAQRYGADLRRADNVTVYLNASVTSLATPGGGKTVGKANVATLTGRRFAVGAKVFVLASGAAGNARLLLVSNQQRRAGLGNQHDLVGRFFQEHPRFRAAFIAVADPSLRPQFYDYLRVGESFIQGYLSTSRRIQAAEGLLDVQFRVQPTYDPGFEDVEDTAEARALKQLVAEVNGGERSPLALGRRALSVLRDLGTWQRYAVPGAPLPLPYPEVVGALKTTGGKDRSRLIPPLLGDSAAFAYMERYGGPIDGLMVTARIEQAPNPASRMSLTDERDALGVPRIALDWRMSEADQRNLSRALELLGLEVGRSGLGRMKLLWSADGSGDALTGWPDDLNGGSHMMGTTRMSDNPRQGVVNRDCRVHGMANLYVAGSSVFPTGGAGTPTLTLVALALRLSDHLRQGALPT